MRATKRHLGISLALIVLTAFPTTLVAGQRTSNSTQTSADWSAVNSVPAGEKLSVKLKNGKTVEGKLVSVTADGLTLSANGKSINAKKDEVRSVYHVTGGSATKATLIGLAVGAGGGTAIGLAGGGNDSFDKIDNAVTAGLAVIGAGVGATVGYLIGRKNRKRVLIYQTSQP